MSGDPKITANWEARLPTADAHLDVMLRRGVTQADLRSSTERISMMHDSLRGFYRPSEEQTAKVWESGTFFLDANVLVNLYRYPEKAREDVFRVLSQIGAPLIVPFQAALEFERNRINVIADQGKRFRDVRKLVESTVSSLKGQIEQLQLQKLHTAIKPDAFLKSIDAAVKGFLDRLKQLEDKQPDVHDQDAPRERIGQLMANGVSGPPESQKVLDGIYEAGQKRFALLAPPGYKDDSKDGLPDFQFGGLVYRRKFGDLILWEQLLAECTHLKATHAALVTDDEKSDWWWLAESSGPKKLGPRPELVEEIRRRAGVEVFQLYTSEQLVLEAPKRLGLPLQTESAQKIRETNEQPVNERVLLRTLLERDAVPAVIEWIKKEHSLANIRVQLSGDVDIIATYRDGRRVGYVTRLDDLCRKKHEESRGSVGALRGSLTRVATEVRCYRRARGLAIRQTCFHPNFGECSPPPG